MKNNQKRISKNIEKFMKELLDQNLEKEEENKMSKEEMVKKWRTETYIWNTILAIEDDAVIPEARDCMERLLEHSLIDESLNKTEIEDVLIGLSLIAEKYKAIKEKCETMLKKSGPYPKDEEIEDLEDMDKIYMSFFE